LQLTAGRVPTECVSSLPDLSVWRDRGTADVFFRVTLPPSTTKKRRRREKREERRERESG